MPAPAPSSAGSTQSTAMTLPASWIAHRHTAAIDFRQDLQRLCELARDRGLPVSIRVRDGLWCYARFRSCGIGSCLA